MTMHEHAIGKGVCLMSLEQLLAKLPDAKKSGKGYVTRCPAHEDRRASLSVSAGADGTVLIHCHAGCTPEAIVAAVGMTIRDLFPKIDAPPSSPRPSGKSFGTPETAIRALERQHGKADHIYVYCDRQKVPVGMVIRWDKPEGKDIRPIARFSDGWRITAMPEPRPLYHLPEVASELVIVQEGEGKTDAARGLGFVAVTSCGGAKAPDKTDWTPLAGLEVWILPDCDQPGREYAKAVASKLARLTPPAKVKIVVLPGLPEHGDLVDWIEGQGEAAEPACLTREIARLGAAAEYWSGQEAPSKVAMVDAEWTSPQPLPSGLLPVQAFEYELLPEAFRPFVNDVAERMQCPPDFTAVAMMIVEATIVGRKVGIRPKKHDDWLVVPNLWGGVIGRPGVMKTAAIQQPMKFLYRLEQDAKAEFEEAMKEHGDQLLVAEIKEKQRKAAIEKAVNAKRDPHEAAKAYVVDKPNTPTRRRFIVNDTTVEKIGELLTQNPNGLLVFRDEIAGFIERLSRQGSEGDRAFYLESWEGTGCFTYDRIGRGTIDVGSTTLSILGSAQPGKFFGYLQGAVHGGAGDDGLSQRFQMLVYPDVTTDWRTIDRWPDNEAKQKAWDSLVTLNKMTAGDVGATDDESVPYVHFAYEAQAMFDDWRAALEKRLRTEDEHPAMEAHLAKYRSLIPSLALLIGLADGDHSAIFEQALGKALKWGVYLESHASRIYNAAVNPANFGAKALSQRLRKGEIVSPFSVRDIYRKHWGGLKDRECIEPALDLLVTCGWLRTKQEKTEGRPITLYQVHPQIAPRQL